VKLVFARPRVESTDSPMHVETFFSTRTGDPIRLLCSCEAGEDHITVPGRLPIAPEVHSDTTHRK
jgi:hypothetical protein